MQLVLVVESDPEMSRTLRMYLENAGFPVKPFLTTADVVPEAERLRPILIIVGKIAGSEYGSELCQHIRLSSLLRDTPIVLLAYRFPGTNPRARLVVLSLSRSEPRCPIEEPADGPTGHRI